MQNLHDQIGVGIVHGVDQRFAMLFRILRVEVTGNLLQYGAVERLSDDLAVETIHVEVQLVLQQLAVGYLTRHGVITDNRIAFFVMDTLVAQFGMNIVRNVMVNQISVDDSLPIGVLEHRLAENLRGLQGGRCG